MPTTTPIPVPRITDAPGVGTSTTGCGRYTRLAATGHHVVYVDIDQLGLLLPRPAADPGAHRHIPDISYAAAFTGTRNCRRAPRTGSR